MKEAKTKGYLYAYESPYIDGRVSNTKKNATSIASSGKVKSRAHRYTLEERDASPVINGK